MRQFAPPRLTLFNCCALAIALLLLTCSWASAKTVRPVPEPVDQGGDIVEWPVKEAEGSPPGAHLFVPCPDALAPLLIATGDTDDLGLC